MPNWDIERLSINVGKRPWSLGWTALFHLGVSIGILFYQV